MASRTGDSDSESPVEHQGSLQFHSPASWDANSNRRPIVAGTPSTSSGFYCSVQMFEAHAGVHSAELPADARLGRVAGLCPRVNRGLRRHAWGQSLPCQDAQFRFSPVEPTAVSRCKHQLYAPGQAARLGRRKSPVERGVGMDVPMVADQDQALGLAVARMIRRRPAPGAPSPCPCAGDGVGRTPLTQRIHEQPEGAGAVPHVFVGRIARSRRCGVRLSAHSGLGCSFHADHRIARIVGLGSVDVGF